MQTKKPGRDDRSDLIRITAAAEQLFAVAFPGHPDTPIEVQDAIFELREEFCRLGNSPPTKDDQ